MGEVDQFRQLPIRVRRVDDRRQVHEDERELERPPLRLPTVHVARVFTRLVGLNRCHEHRLVGELECEQRLRIRGEERDAFRNALLRAVRLLHQLSAGLLQAGARKGLVPLFIDPLAVRLDDWRERVGYSFGIELREICHPERRVVDGAVTDRFHFVPRQLRRSQTRDLAVRGHHALRARVVTDRPLNVVAEVEREDLLVVVVRIFAASVRAGDEPTLVRQGHADLEGEAQILIPFKRDSVIDEKETEHARFRAQAPPSPSSGARREGSDSARPGQESRRDSGGLRRRAVREREQVRKGRASSR